MKSRYIPGDASSSTECFIKPTSPPSRGSPYVGPIPPTSAPVYAVLTYKLSSTIALTHMSNAELAQTKENFKARFLQANLRISRAHIEYTRLYESTSDGRVIVVAEITLRRSVTDAHPHAFNPSALDSIMAARITAVAIVANGVTTTVDPEYITDDGYDYPVFIDHVADADADDDDDDDGDPTTYIVLAVIFAGCWAVVWYASVKPHEDSLQASPPLDVRGPAAVIQEATRQVILQHQLYPTQIQPVYPLSLAVPPAPPVGAQPHDALPPPGPPPAYHELYTSAPASQAHRQSSI